MWGVGRSIEATDLGMIPFTCFAGFLPFSSHGQLSSGDTLRRCPAFRGPCEMTLPQGAKGSRFVVLLLGPHTGTNTRQAVFHFPSFACGHTALPAPCVEKIISPSELFGSLAENQLTRMIRVYFWTLDSILLVRMFVFTPVHSTLTSPAS